MFTAARVAFAVAASLVMAIASASEPGAASVATVSIGSGPYAGKYTLRTGMACTMPTASKRGPAAFFATLLRGDPSRTQSTDKSNPLADVIVTVPNIDAQHIGEIYVQVAFDRSPKGGAIERSKYVGYTIDTRPDAALDSFELKERMGGMAGSGAVKLSREGHDKGTATFQGKTKEGIAVDVSVQCYRNDAA